MKNILFVMAIMLYCFAGTASAQVNYVYLTSAKVIFVTPSQSPVGNDNKDQDTAVQVQIWSAYGYMSTVTDYNADIEFQDNNSSNEAYLNAGTPQRNYLPKAEFNSGKAVFIITPNGNDTWIFIPTIVFTFSDGTTRTLASNGPLAVNENSRMATSTY